MARPATSMMEITLCLLFMLSLLIRADALPTALRSDSDGELECHRAADYSTEWFLENTKDEYKHSLLKNNALFYSAGMSEAARRLANETKLVTIWDVWPCYLYNHLEEQRNPLRCIHGNDTERTHFFGNMSEAFAMKAQHSATVLHSCDNYPQPPTNGIWATVEFPALQQGGVIDFLKKVNENKTLSEVFWRRPRDFVLGLWDDLTNHAAESHNGELKRRKVDAKPVKGPPPLPPDFHAACMSPKQLEFFDNVRW